MSTWCLFGALSDFRWIHDGIRSRDLRPLVEHHLARPYGHCQMAYDLRRLVRKRLLERIPKSHRYVLTALGRRLVLFCTRLYSRVLCLDLVNSTPRAPPHPSPWPGAGSIVKRPCLSRTWRSPHDGSKSAHSAE